jgi:hypothetical protein
MFRPESITGDTGWNGKEENWVTRRVSSLPPLRYLACDYERQNFLSLGFLDAGMSLWPAMHAMA